MRIASVALVSVLLLAACGGGDEADSGGDTAETIAACEAYLDPDQVLSAPKKGLTASDVRALSNRAEDPDVSSLLAVAADAWNTTSGEVRFRAVIGAATACQRFLTANR